MNDRSQRRKREGPVAPEPLAIHCPGSPHPCQILPSREAPISSIDGRTHAEPAEEMLRRCEELVRLLLESTTEGIYGIDCHGNCTFANLACARHLGVSGPEALLGRNMHDLVHHSRADGSPYPREECPACQVVREGKEIHVDKEVFWHCDGTSFPVEYWSYPLHRGPNDTGAVVSFIDVTRRKRAEESLCESEERFRQVVEHMQGVFWLCDAKIERMIYISPSYEKVWGRTCQSLYERPRSFLEAVHPQDRNRVGVLIKPPRTGEGFDCDYRIFRPDGSVRWVRARGFPICDALGELSRVAGIAEDITERKKREEQLQKLWRAIEQSPNSVIITDAQATIEYVNPRFVQTTGYTAAEAVGKTPSLWRSGRHPEAFYTELWATISAGKEWHGEICNRKKTGELYWEAGSITPVRGPTGEITHFVAVKEDITPAKREAVLAGLLHKLDQHILQGARLNEILELICKQLASLFEDALAWIGMAQPNGSLTLYTDGGTELGFLERLQERWDDTPGGKGPAMRAIRSGELQRARTCNSQFRRGQAGHNGQEIRTAVAAPLFLKGTTAGALVVYSPRSDTAEEGAQAYLRKVAALISVALERTLAQQQLRLQSVALSSAANAVFITDCDGRIEWVNDAFTRLSGYSAAEAIGQTPRLLKSGKQDAAFYEEFWRTLRHGDVWRGELEERHKNGACFVVDQTVTPLRDAQGRLTHFVAIHEDITARKAVESRLDYLAHHDPLTDLPNRALFHGYLPIALAQARRSGRMLALLFIDLDRFKTINDTLGHHVGDLLLKAVADRLRDTVRSSDIIVRLGGDEFAVVQPDLTNATGSSELARKLVAVLAAPFVLESHQVYTSASIGISVFPSDDNDPEQLVKNADLAMYRAKSHGRNNYQFFAPDMNRDLQNRLAVEKDLHLALDQDQFVLYYQPQLSLRSEELVGLEALIRWQHPDRGLIGPDQFIPIAEESGLIDPLGRWVLLHACRQARAWRDAGLAPPPIAVNVSALQFRHHDVARITAETLDETGLDPRALGLELTESAFTQDLEALANTLWQLHEQGVALSIDDFGSGYSSLAYLKRLPVECLKIDKSFVKDIVHDASSAAIVRAVIGLGHNLGFKVLAEGVESEAQRAFLRGEGCDEIQGYLVNRPLPAEVVAALLPRRSSS